MLMVEGYSCLEICYGLGTVHTLDDATELTGDTLPDALGFGNREMGFAYGFFPGRGILLAAPLIVLLRLEGCRSCDVVGGERRLVVELG